MPGKGGPQKDAAWEGGSERRKEGRGLEEEESEEVTFRMQRIPWTFLSGFKSWPQPFRFVSSEKVAELLNCDQGQAQGMH